MNPVLSSIGLSCVEFHFENKEKERIETRRGWTLEAFRWKSLISRNSQKEQGRCYGVALIEKSISNEEFQRRFKSIRS